MVTLQGQLAIKTIHGRNGDFNVGRLTTPIGEFVTKNAELDQYREGKYDGDFNIVEIRPSMYTTGGRMVIEMRAVLGGMTLSNTEPLSRDEAQKLSPQEVDPVDEEAHSPPPVAPAPEPVAPPTPAPPDPLVDTTPFEAVAAPSSKATAASAEEADEKLFGALWPLGPLVKLDATVNRRVLRQQRARLNELGYEIDFKDQTFYPKKAA